MNRKAVIPTTALLTFGIITLADIQNHQRLPNSREWLGFVIVFTLLSAGSDLGIPVTYGMAMLVFVTVALTRGPEALEFITGKVSTKPLRPKGKVPKTPQSQSRSQKPTRT